MEGYGNENPGAFQSTRPLRGATALLGINAVVLSISTHAPLAGRDTSTLPSCSTPAEFQPTRPLRGATSVRRFAGLRLKHFNPRAPCGARLIAGSTRQSTAEFQPTRPLRGATRHGAGVPRAGGISTHAPLAGRDQALRPRKTHTDYFNPRAPCGARRPIK